MKRALLAALLLGACAEPMPDVEPVFEESYRDDYAMVRDCRRSIDHDLTWVRIWTNDAATSAYQSRIGTFPDGSTIVKEEFGDEGCNELIGFAAMHREAGYAPAAGDWRWQEVTHEREVIRDGPEPGCFLCHEQCGVAPDGFDWTCAVP